MRAGAAMRTGRHTYVVSRGGDGAPVRLYDRKNDPCQVRDTAAEMLETVRELDAALREWLRATGDPWLEGNSGG